MKEEVFTQKSENTSSSQTSVLLNVPKVEVVGGLGFKYSSVVKFPNHEMNNAAGKKKRL